MKKMPAKPKPKLPLRAKIATGIMVGLLGLRTGGAQPIPEARARMEQVQRHEISPQAWQTHLKAQKTIEKLKEINAESQKRMSEQERQKQELTSQTLMMARIQDNVTSKGLFLKRTYPEISKKQIDNTIERHNLDKRITRNYPILQADKKAMIKGMPNISEKAIGQFIYSINPDLPLVENGRTLPSLIIEISARYGVAPELVTGLWQAESGCGKKGPAVITKSIGNEKYFTAPTDQATTYSRHIARDGTGYKKYPNFETAIRSACKELQRYAQVKGRRTLATVAYTWSPPSENITEQHIANIFWGIKRQATIELWLEGK